MALQAESFQIYSRPGDATGNGTLNISGDVTGIKTFAPTRHMQDTNVLHDKQMFNVDLVAATVTKIVHLVREGRWQLDAFPVYFQTGSTSGTVTVTVDTGTQAPGAGTAQLTGTVSLAAAAQQTQLNGAPIASPTVAGPGDRFSIVIAGTMTSLANGMAVVTIRRVG